LISKLLLLHLKNERYCQILTLEIKIRNIIDFVLWPRLDACTLKLVGEWTSGRKGLNETEENPKWFQIGLKESSSFEMEDIGIKWDGPTLFLMFLAYSFESEIWTWNTCMRSCPRVSVWEIGFEWGGVFVWLNKQMDFGENWDYANIYRKLHP